MMGLLNKVLVAVEIQEHWEALCRLYAMRNPDCLDEAGTVTAVLQPDGYLRIEARRRPEGPPVVQLDVAPADWRWLS